MLIGEPGVGKTAIVEGLAQRIVKGDVPETLKGVKIISLDMVRVGGQLQKCLLTLSSALPAAVMISCPPAMG